MKKLIILLMILIMLVPASVSAGGLRRLQNYIGNHTPYSAGSMTIVMAGEIMDVYRVGTGNHWEMKIRFDDDDALTPTGAEYPYFIAHFRLHLEECPFHVGDSVMVEGDVNPLYSSVMVPLIDVKYINDSDEY